MQDPKPAKPLERLSHAIFWCSMNFVKIVWCLDILHIITIGKEKKRKVYAVRIQTERRPPYSVARWKTDGQ